MNKVNWTVVVLVGLIALLVLIVGAGMLGGRGYSGYGGWGMMGPWMMGGMFFMWIIPLGFIVLVALGVAWLVRNAGGSDRAEAPHQHCPSCGRNVESDWKACPYCGTALTQ